MVIPEPREVTGSGAVATGDVNLSGVYVAGRDVNVIQAKDTSKPAYHSLPRDIAHFIGRTDQIRLIESILDPAEAPPPILVISNGPGWGKSALAVHVAHRLAPVFPNAQLHIRLGDEELGDLPPDDALRRLLTQLGVAAEAIPQHVDDRAALYRSTMPTGTLIVLDNATSELQVEKLLPAGPRCAAIITSRYPLAELEGINMMELDRLSDSEAYSLLERKLGPDRTASAPDSVREIAGLCGGLPLALQIVGALLQTPAHKRMPLAHFAAQLRDEKARLGLMKTKHRDVRASFVLSYQALSPPAARLFRLLGLLKAPDFSDSLVHAIDGSAEASQSLGALLDAHLIEPVNDARTRFHDLMRLFAHDCAMQEENTVERTAALDRAYAWCLDRAARWDAELQPGAHPEGSSAHDLALRSFEQERPLFQGVIHQAAEIGRDDVAWRLSALLGRFYDVRGYWGDWLATAQTAAEAAERLGEPEGLGASFHQLAWVQRLLRQTPLALETARNALRHSTGPSKAPVVAHLGTVLRELHRYDEAANHLDQAAELYRELADSHGEGLVLQSLGHVLLKRRRFEDARPELERAAQLLHESHDPLTEGWAHNNLITLYGNLWRDTEARSHFEASRALFVALGHPQGEAWAYNHVGRVHRQYGRTGDQVACHERARELFERLDDRYGLGWAILDLGLAVEDASLMRNALQIFEEIGEVDGQGWCLTWLARQEQDGDAAEEAARRFSAMGNRHGQGTALSVRGDVEVKRGLFSAAQLSYDHALTLLTNTNDPHREALDRWGLGMLAAREGQADNARELQATALETLVRLGAPEASRLLGRDG